MRILIITSVLFFLSACKNDLNVLAPGKEAVSVYGLLNPNEKVQNIRINKVYLVEGDALAAAQDNNQINYGPGELTVTLERYISGNPNPQLTTVGNSTKKEIVLTETVVTTASGTFSPTQRIWQTTDKLYNSGEYKLIIKKGGSDMEITSQSVSIDSVKPHSSKPFNYNPTLYPMHGQYDFITYPAQVNGLIDYSVLSSTVLQKIKFLSIKDAKVYNVVMRFHYIDSLLDNTTYNRYVDYNFVNVSSSTTNGGENMEVSFYPNDFYTNVAREIAKQPAISNLKNRRSFYMEYVITAGAENLFDFLKVNAPSNTIAQDKPYYTNIAGGVGIFSCKSKSVITHDLSNLFIDKIACHPSTNPYKFCNSSGITTGVCP